MEEERIKKFIEENKNKFPLSYNDLIFKSKIEKGKKKNDFIQFFKPIIRF
jgi:hypothetical protein